MDGQSKRPRYKYERTATGMWAIIDRHISKIRMHNDVVETFAARSKARARVAELNKADRTGEPEQQQLAG